jgi:crotonobetainyl-CoA:carnitine CoA-transferase CaiB-like acyl-CoA transferase
VPIKLRNHPVGLDGAAPVPGAHNAEILGRLGLGPADLDALRAEGVI